jgi:hypothetical protein
MLYLPAAKPQSCDAATNGDDRRVQDSLICLKLGNSIVLIR